MEFSTLRKVSCQQRSAFGKGHASPRPSGRGSQRLSTLLPLAPARSPSLAGGMVGGGVVVGGVVGGCVGAGTVPKKKGKINK